MFYYIFAETCTGRVAPADRYSETVSTNMYSEADDSIDILFKDGSTENISRASDMLNIQLLSKKVRKYYFCFLRDSE